MNALAVKLFGTTRVRSPIESATTQVQPTRKVADLLGYLLMGGNRSYDRAELAERFWGDQGPARARRCLSTAVWRLRQVLEPTGLPQGTYLSTGQSARLGFNWSSAHQIDAVDLDSALDSALGIPAERLSRTEAATLEEGLSLYTGEFLSGAQDNWALHERDRLSARHLDGMTHLLRYKLHSGQYQVGLALGSRILARDPLREDVHRDMMHLYVRTGKRCRAIRQYHECRALLRYELQVDPAPETEQVHRSLCQGGVPRVDASQQTVDQAVDRLHRAVEELDSARALVESMTRRKPF